MNVLITLSMSIMSKIPFKKLKPGKSDGFGGLTSDYIINVSHLFNVYLSHLFTNMLYYCFTPKSFCISTMILIPKGSNKDTSDIRNYRGTAFSSLLSKLFDSCIISLNQRLIIWACLTSDRIYDDIPLIYYNL